MEETAKVGPVPDGDARTSGLAVASLILGICGTCTAGISAVVGLILGIVGLNQINKSAGRVKGRGLAIAGIAVSGASLALMLVMVPVGTAIVLPSFAKGREAARTTLCASRLSQLCAGAVMYTADSGDALPPADDWPNAILPYVHFQNLFNSPFDEQAGRAYAMNANLGGLKLSKIANPGRTVLIYEAQFGSPPAGGPELLPPQPRSPTGYVVGFVDGHVEVLAREAAEALIWKPGSP